MRELYKFRDIEILLIRQPYRRRISMVHQLTGQVKVTCPKSLGEAQLIEFLERHVEWIKSNLAQFDTIRTQHPAKKYQQNEPFMFMGRELTLQLLPGGRGGDAEIQGDRLIVYLPTIGRNAAFPQRAAHEISHVLPNALPNASLNPRAALVEKHVLAFYEKQGRKVLAERVRFFALKMGLHPSAVSYRSQKTRWGSCTIKGKISLNWRLIFAPPETLDYVVIHELSHLKHHNHSAAFWNLVGSQCADYAAHKRWLREHVYDADFLAKSSEIHPESSSSSQADSSAD